MKRRMIASFLVIALVAAVIGGATVAHFTDTAESEQISLQTGTLLIGIDDYAWVDLGVDLSNLNPGDEWCGEIVVVNEGTKNLKFRGVMCFADTLGEELHDFGDREGYGTNPLSEVLQMTLTVANPQPYHPMPDVMLDHVIYNDVIGNYEDWDFDQHAPEYPILEPFGPGEKIIYEVCFVFPAEADNRYQGSTISLKFGYLAGQWLPGEELYPEFEPCSLELVLPGEIKNVTKDEYYATIDAAIAAADEGDTIIVGKGTYTIPGSVYDITVDNLTLKSAAGPDQTTLISPTIRLSGTTGITIDGFTIDSTSPARAIGPGGSDGTTIKNNIINAEFRGIQGDWHGRPINLTITGNTFNTDFGVAGTEDVTGLLIAGNIFNCTTEAIGVGVGVEIVDEDGVVQPWPDDIAWLVANNVFTIAGVVDYR